MTPEKVRGILHCPGASMRLYTLETRHHHERARTIHWRTEVPMRQKVTAILISTLWIACGIASCGGGGGGQSKCPPNEFGTCDVVDCHAAQSCQGDCPGGVCGDVDCTEAGDCAVNCSGAAHCGKVAGTEAGTCSLDCSGGSSCDLVTCKGVDSCAVTCSGGSSCDIDCTNAKSCEEIKCSGGSPCLLVCAGAAGCGFAECSGGSGMAECPDGILVCNRECPKCGDGVCDGALESCDSCKDDCAC